jgi:cyanobactin maturation PatA/PatG family protease
MTIVGLKELWAETLGDSQICVAVLDGPVEQSHPSLAAADLTQRETLASDSDDRGSASQHGTHVSSVIFGQHDGSVKGIAPHCRGVIVPIFKDGADGSIAPCSQLDLARAIMQAIQEGAHIINISGGELSSSGTAHPLLADAVQNCVNNNILIVAAAGNEGCECVHVPGALPSVLAVGAMNVQGLPLGFSNWGDKYRLQGVLAPGENILGATPDGGTATQSGTSYATPIVSGIAALLLSLQRKLGEEPNPQAVRTAILESAFSCDPQAVIDCRPFMMGSLNVSGVHARIKKGHKGMSVDQPGKNIRIDTAANKSEPAADEGQTMLERQTMLKVGDVAPDFSLKDHTGQDVRLSDYKGKTVILWFYPQAEMPEPR